jgi:hypothetical protein
MGCELREFSCSPYHWQCSRSPQVALPATLAVRPMLARRVKPRPIGRCVERDFARGAPWLPPRRYGTHPLSPGFWTLRPGFLLASRWSCSGLGHPGSATT